MTKYRVLPVSHTEYRVQRKGLFFWKTMNSFSPYDGMYEGPRKFPFKESAEEFILSEIRETRKKILEEQTRKKELRNFKKLNPPYEFP